MPLSNKRRAALLPCCWNRLKSVRRLPILFRVVVLLAGALGIRVYWKIHNYGHFPRLLPPRQPCETFFMYLNNRLRALFTDFINPLGLQIDFHVAAVFVIVVAVWMWWKTGRESTELDELERQ
jgi:hypothetical protein